MRTITMRGSVSILFSLLIQTVTGNNTGNLVQVEAEVISYPGDAVNLKCTADGSTGVQLTQVSWIYTSDAVQRVAVAMFHPNFGTNYPTSPLSDRIRFTAVPATITNASIQITDVRMTDGGIYTCEYSTYPSGLESGATSLRVLSRPCADSTSPPATLSTRPVSPSSTTRGPSTPSVPSYTSAVEGEVRLANGGSSSCSGRVEVYHQGQWGTVCDDLWDLSDAQVVCTQLNCGRALSALSFAHFGQGSGQIWLDDVGCSGNESSITRCTHPGFGIHDCDHSEDAGVICEGRPVANPTSPPATLSTRPVSPSRTTRGPSTPSVPANTSAVEGEVRLANGGSSSCSGRVEVYHQGQWGTVCDDLWDLSDAQVVCRQLNCGRALSALSNAHFGQGSGQIWLDNLRCSGNELSITRCRHPAFGIHDCGHHEDAGVICEVKQPDSLTPELICGRNELQLGLPLTGLTVAGLDPSTAHLADPVCSGGYRALDGTAWYGVNPTDGLCGNTLTTNRTHAVYSNSLFVYPVQNPSSGNSNNNPPVVPLSFPFSCAYPLETEIDLNVAVRPRPLFGGVAGVSSKAQASMSLYQNSNYAEPYPQGPVSLPLGSTLYVGVAVEERDSRFVVVLEDCYATRTSSPDGQDKYFLVQNRCPTDGRQVTVVESGSSLQARFSALLFLYQGDYQDVFLHCSLSLCDQRSSSCSPVCSRRQSRSAFESKLLEPLTIGPITWDKTLE